MYLFIAIDPSPAWLTPTSVVRLNRLTGPVEVAGFGFARMLLLASLAVIFCKKGTVKGTILMNKDGTIFVHSVPPQQAVSAAYYRRFS